MRTINWICGIIALLMLIVFLGKYAVSIGSIPLWIIIVGVMILPVYDLIKSMKGSNGDSGTADTREG